MSRVVREVLIISNLWHGTVASYAATRSPLHVDHIIPRRAWRV